MSIKPVTENDVDSLFDEIERLRELCLKAVSSDESMSEQWTEAASLQKAIHGQVVRALAIELNKATSVEDVHSTITTYMFDDRTGLLRGKTCPPSIEFRTTWCNTPDAFLPCVNRRSTSNGSIFG